MKKLVWTLIPLSIALFGLQACDSGGETSTAEVEETTPLETENTSTTAREDNSSAEMENTDVVASGTYTGTAVRVDPKEKEIYVETEEGNTLELYLNEQTTITRGGQTVSFDALEQGQKVEVQVEKNDQSLEPISVRILE